MIKTFATSSVQNSRYASSKSIAIPVGVLLIIAVAAISKPDMLPIVVNSLADAYLAVSVFVAATLLIFNSLEHIFKINISETLSRYRVWQTPVASVLGALPGCGGAILVTTYFIQGRLRFGAVVAALTATMGDAAFLLLAQEPGTGMAVFLLGIVVGIISGYVVDYIHRDDFLRPPVNKELTQQCLYGYTSTSPYLLLIFMLLFIPGLTIGILQAFQLEEPAFLPENFSIYLGFIGAFFSIIVWLLSKHKMSNSLQTTKVETPTCQNYQRTPSSSIEVLLKAFRDTNFITTWVVAGFLFYEFGVHLFGLNLGEIAQAWAPLLPLLAIIVGFLPGCGPQILVTTLYLGGTLPLSAQLGNAISNDGDALFPALAMAPKAAIVATLYSALPAFMVAYGYYWLFEKV